MVGLRARIALGILFLSQSIHGATISWIGSSGDWNTPGNWAGGVVPGAADDAVINPVGAITVTHNAGSNAVHSVQSTQPFTLSGGVLYVSASFVASNTFTLSGGTLQNAVLTTTNGASFVVSSGTLNGATVNGTLDVGNSYNAASLTVTNGLTLNGTALVGSPVNSWYGGINVSGSQTIGGSGAIVFGSYSPYYNALWLSVGGSTLTIAPGITIRGKYGTVGYGSWWGGPQNITIINQGIIQADVSGGNVAINAQPLVNQGALNILNGGTLATSGTVSNNSVLMGTGGTLSVSGLWDNRSGVMIVGGTNQLALSSGGRIWGGSVNATNGGSIAVNNIVFDGLTVNGTLDVGYSYNAASLTVTNGLTLNGTALVGSQVNSWYGGINVSGSQTIGGSGAIVFGSYSPYYNALWLSVGGSTLTIAPGITIRGKYGIVGYGSWWGGPQNITIINQGIIQADVAGGTIYVYAQPFVNQGVATETLGTLSVNGILDLTGQTILLDTNTWFLKNISSGSIIRGGQIITTNGASLVVSQVTLDGVNVTGNIDVGKSINGASLTLTNGLILNGSLLIGNPSNGWYGMVNAAGSQTLSGNGTVVFGNASSCNNYLGLLYPNTSMTLGPSITIHGQNGTVGYTSCSGGLTNNWIYNQGSIQADVAGGSLYLNALGSFTNAGSIIVKSNCSLYLGVTFNTTNLGNLTCSNGGIVNVSGVFQNSNNIFNPTNFGGTWVLYGGTIRGGAIQSSNGSSFYVAGGTLDGVTFNGLLDVGNTYNGAALAVTNGLTLNGLALVGNSANGSYGGIGFGGNQTLGGNATILFGNDSYAGYGYPGRNALWLTAPGSALTIGSNVLIHGQYGTIGAYRVYPYNGPSNVSVLNQGIISADVSGGTLNLNPVAGFTNVGSLMVTSNCTMNIGGGFTLNALGTLTCNAAGTVNIIGTIFNTNSTLILGNYGGRWMFSSFDSVAGAVRGGGVVVSPGTSLLIVNGLFDGVTVNGLLDVGNAFSSAKLTVTNGLTMNGTALIGSPTNGNFGEMVFAGSQLLGGNGSIVFGNEGYNGYSGYVGRNAMGISPAGATLTIGSGITIYGKNGTIGYNPWWGGSQSNNVVNQGTIFSTNSGQISISASLVNLGNLVVTNSSLTLGGTVNLSSLGAFNATNSKVYLIGTFLNTNNTLWVNGLGGTWYLQNSGYIFGGTIIATNGASLVVSSGTLDGATFNGLLDVGNTVNGASLAITNGLVLNGTALIGNNSGNYGGLFFGGSQGMGGSANVLFGSSSSDQVVLSQAGTSLILSNGVTLHGQAGNIGWGGSSPNITLINQGAILADGAGGMVSINGNPFVNQGTLGAPYGTLYFAGQTNNFPSNNITIGVSGPGSNGSLGFAGSAPLSSMVLTVSLNNGYVPAAGNTFTVLTYGSLGSYLGNLFLPPPSPYWQGNYGPTSFTLKTANAVVSQVNLMAPTNNMLFRDPTNVVMIALATNNYFPVTEVDFLHEGTLIGIATNAPYAFTWTNPPGAVYSLTALAKDANGGVAASTPVSISVLPSVAGTNYVWTGSASSDWFNPANWSPPGVPGVQDSATINSGSSTLASRASIYSLFLNGGSLGGSGNLVVTNTFDWSAGNISCPVTISSNAVMNWIGTGNSTIYTLSSPLTNYGTINWFNGGNLQVYNNNSSVLGGVVNQAGASFNIQCDQNIYGYYGYEYLLNAGLLRKLAGTNTTYFYVGLTNSGSLLAQSGVIYLQNGGSLGGVMQAATNAVIDFGSGTFTISPAANFQSAGQVNLIGGNFSGTLATTLNWLGGSTPSGVQFTVASNGVLNINPGQSGTTYVYGALTNYGTVNWLSGDIVLYSCNPNGGPLVNQPGALWNIQCDRSLTYTSCSLGANNYFANFGTVQKTANLGATYISVPLTNSGSFLAQSGAIYLQNGGSLGGVMQAATNAAIDFASGNFVIAPTTVFQGPGQVNLTGGNIIGTLGTTLNWVSGSINSGTTLVVATNGVLNINPGQSGTTYVYGALTNYGTVNWLSGDILLYSCNPNGGPLVNQPGALWNIQCDRSLSYTSCSLGANNYFANFGTVQKTANLGATYISVPLTNSGSFLAQSGAIYLQSGGSLGGVMQAATNATIDFASGNFVIAPTTVIQGPGQVNLTGGNIIGTLGTTLNWVSGSINSSTTLVVATNGVLNINPGQSGTTYVYGELTNYGTVNWLSGDIVLYSCNPNGGPLVNQPGALWNIQCDRSLTYTSCILGTNNYFANFGTVQKTANLGATYISVPLTNSGSFLAQSGAIYLQNGGSLGGVMQAATNAAIDFASGNFVIAPTTVFQGPGQVNLAGGNIIGTLGTTLNWVSGSINSGTTLVVATNGVLNINPGQSGTTYVYGELTNYGTVNWLSGDIVLSSCNPNGGPLVNQPGALWNIQCDRSLSYYSCSLGASNYFVNFGTVQKTANLGATYIYVPFTNSGSLLAQSGVLNLANGGSLEGTVQTDPSARLGLSGTFFGTLSGAVNLAGDLPGGWLLIGTNGVLNINPGQSGTTYVYGALTNYGTVNWLSGDIVLPSCNPNGGPLVNQSGALWNIQCDRLLSYYSCSLGASNYFVNFGTVQKTANLGATYIYVPFTNSGSLLAQSGVLNLANGGSLGGTVQTDPSARLGLSGTFFGTLSGAVNLAGDLPGGWLVIGTNGVLNINPGQSGTTYVYGALTNYGTVNWLSADIVLPSCNPNGGPLVNQPGALWNIQCDRSLTFYSCSLGANNYLLNLGLVAKNSTAGATTIYVPFTNAATIDVELGTIAFNSGYAQVGANHFFGLTSASNSGKLNFSGNLALDGTLGIGLRNGYLPKSGDSFILESYGTRTGAFSYLNLPAPGTNLAWQLSYGPSSLVLQAVGGTGSSAQVTGTVLDNVGRAVTNLTVFAYLTNTTGALYFTALTDGQGTYGIAVSNGTYQVGIQNPTARGYNNVTNQIVVINNSNRVVNFTVQPFTGSSYTITTSVNPANSGLAAGDGTFPLGAEVILTASPNTNALPYFFSSWTENGVLQSQSNTYVFTANHDRQLTANFALPIYTISVSNNPPVAGSVSGAGSFVAGSSNTLVASAVFGYRFTNWTEFGAVLGTNPSLSLVVMTNHTIVANYFETNLLHFVTTASSPTGLVAVSGSGTYTNGQTAFVSAPTTVTNTGNRYFFQQFLFNGSYFTNSSAFSKTFSTLDITNVAYVATYISQTIVPQLVGVSPNLGNPVPATTNFVLFLRFDRSMNTNVFPQIQFSNLTAGAQQPLVPTNGGKWTSTYVANDTFQAPPVLFTHGMDGTNLVYVSLARDVLGDPLSPTNVLNVVVDATFPTISSVAATAGPFSAQVSWTTDEPSSSQIDYGVDASYGASTPFFSQLITNHAITVSGLATLTGYHFRVRSRDAAGNEQNSTDHTFTTPGAPDLAVSWIQTPNSAFVGQTITATIAITNQGNALAPGPWVNDVYLANDTNGNGAQFLGRFILTNAIPSGSNAVVSQPVILPSGLNGNYYLGVLLDSGSDLFELTRTNNYVYGSAGMSVSAADLAVISVTAPTSAQFGQTFSVAFSVTNIGGSPAGASWNDRLYLSAVSNSPAGGTLLSTSTGVSPLAPGHGYSVTNVVGMPLMNTLAPGTYYLVAVADGGNAQLEAYKVNNTKSVPIILSLPPLPDLAPSGISSPSVMTPGQPSTVSWMVTNVGAAAAAGSWRESLYLVPTNLASAELWTNFSAYPRLGAFEFTSSLPVGSAVLRTQAITIPITGPAGNLNLAVVVDPDNVEVEQSKSNNIGFTAGAVQIPNTLMLFLPATNVSESGSSIGLSCLIERNGDLSQPLAVNLLSSATNHLMVPGNLVFPANSAVLPFVASVLDDGIPGPDAVVSITAGAPGFLAATSQVTVANTDVPSLSIILATNQVDEGQWLSVTVVASTPNPQPVVVSIGASSQSALALPGTVVMPANSNAVSFSILAIQSTLIAPNQTYTLSASSPGYASSSALLTVLNNNIPVINLALSRTNINEADGPFASVGTVSRQPVTDQPITVTLTSSNVAAAIVPAQVTIPGLQQSAAFYIAAVNDTNVSGPRQSLLTAQAFGISATPIGAPATALLTVQDNNGPALHLHISAKTASRAQSNAVTAVIYTAIAPTNSLVIDLVSSAPDQVQVPSTVTLPAGQTNTLFSLNATNDGVTVGSYYVSVNASAAGYASGSDSIVITDGSLPDLVVSSITVPSTAYSTEPMSLSFRLLNDGLAAITNSVVQNIYLTTDPISGNYLSVGSATFSGTLQAGQYVDQSLNIPGSSLPPPGTYYAIVQADAGGAVTEADEANNYLVGTSPIVITAEYTAVVHANIANAVAGVPVPLAGHATLTAGGPAANKPVNILVTLRGIQRVLAATTDANGDFTAIFTPLPNEAGAYSVAAVLPGVTVASAQGYFNILGMNFPAPATDIQVAPGIRATNQFALQNMGDAPLTGLSASISNLAPNLTVGVSLSGSSLPGMGNATLTLSLLASDASALSLSPIVHVTSAEGAAVDLPLSVSVVPPQPVLAASPAQLGATMLVGGQTILQFTVQNIGGSPSGPLNVILPSVYWMSFALTNPLPSLDPGQSNQVSILLTPRADFPVASITGTIAVNGAAAGVQVPFTLSSVSSATGALIVRTTDEYTFFGAGTPPLTNAQVAVIDPSTKTTLASGTSDANGLFYIQNLPQGTYEVDVSADHHSPSKGAATISAGQTNGVEAFLPLQAVTYSWTVVPSQIEEQSTITIQATFQTDVPIPVVVPTPTSFDLRSLDQPGKSMDVSLTLVNNGLIAAQDVVYTPPSDPNFRVDFATTNVGTLPAHSTITLPMRITRLAAQPAAKSATAKSETEINQLGCIIYGQLAYGYDCGGIHIGEGDHVVYFANFAGCFSPLPPPSIPIEIRCLDCGGPPAQNTPIVVTRDPMRTNTIVCDLCWHLPHLAFPDLPIIHIPTLPSFQIPFSCDDCVVARLSKLLGCVTDLVPGDDNDGAPEIPPEKECLQNKNDCFQSLRDGDVDWRTIGDCLHGFIPCFNANLPKGKKIPPWAGKAYKRFTCLYDVCTACDNIPGHKGICGLQKIDYFSGSGSPNQASKSLPLGSSSSTVSEDGFSPLFTLAQTMQSVLAPHEYYFGSEPWFQITDPDGFSALLDQITAATSASSAGGFFITPNEALSLTTNSLPPPLTPSDVTAFISRWNATMTNYSSGIFYSYQAVQSGLTNFIAVDIFTNLLNISDQAMQSLTDQGYVDFDSPWIQAKNSLDAKLSGGNMGTCAEVKLQLSQTATLVRDAFTATLVLNNSGTATISNVFVNVSVQNESGQVATNLFGVGAPLVAGGLSTVDGSMALAPNTSCSAQWTLVPSREAAPVQPANYFVSGTIRYMDNGLSVNVPLTPVFITVQPSPEIKLKYFLQRDVFADDPFTPEIEPSVPFPLGVMVQNVGYGTAFNFRITSGQPTIVDNQKGLLQTFNIIGTQIGGQTVTPSLNANFGDVPALSTRVGNWWLTASLQGLFTEYAASFEHIDPLGNPKLSSFDSIEIHKMIHLVRTDRSSDDMLPDFLVNDLPNPNNLPDTLYLSDGTVQPVATVQSGNVDAAPSAGHLQVQFTANFPAGFTYVLVPDPAAGQLSLLAVQRSNGSNMLGDNFYVTDRTFIGLAQPPIRETKLHLFDYHTNAGPDTYTLLYGAATNSTATSAPVSSVFALPAASPPFFGVAWSGAPYVGASPLAYYDIYVSENGSPFAVWQNQTTATSAMFNGTNGHTYAFYSISTDTAGHREPIPLQPQAQTTVSYTNYPPSVTVSSNNITLNAGQTLSLRVSATDANPQDALTFHLGPGSPPGAVVDPVAGTLTWVTSPSFGGTTNIISIIATDNGQPPLSSTNIVTVVLKQSYFPPFLPAIPDFTVFEGSLLTFTSVALESNVPPRTVSYSLGAGAPTNASVNSQSGVFQWRPTASQAPSTNHVTVIATDNGTPPLSASQAFTVVVKAVSFEYGLSIGTTNLFVGTSNSVPVKLLSSLPLTNLSAIIEIPSAVLTNFTLSAGSPEVSATLLQPLGTNLYSLSFTLNPDLNPGGLRAIAQFGFRAPAQPHSAIVPVRVTGLSALQADGSQAAKAGQFGGRVFVVGAEPLLDMWMSNSVARFLTVYGIPGSSYEVDCTTNLAAQKWQFAGRIPLTNNFEILKVNEQFPSLYYRAFAFSADPPILELRATSPTNATLFMYGVTGTNYTILTATNLLQPVWTNLATFSLTNSFQLINTGPMTNRAQYYKSRRQ